LRRPKLSTIEVVVHKEEEEALSSNYHLHSNGQINDTIHESGTYAWSAQDCELATAFMVTSADSSKVGWQNLR
jgi:hypothetical protein